MKLLLLLIQYQLYLLGGQVCTRQKKIKDFCKKNKLSHSFVLDYLEYQDFPENLGYISISCKTLRTAWHNTHQRGFVTHQTLWHFKTFKRQPTDI